MNNFFLTSVKQIIRLNADDLHSLEQAAVIRHIQKNELLLKQGAICKEIYFIEKGAVFQYYLSDDNAQAIVDLHTAGDWVLDSISFTNQEPSILVIQAYEYSTVYELSIEKIHELIAQSPAFLQLGKLMSNAKERLQFFDQQLSPDEKYQHIIQHRPALLQHFPQHMIASYLKMTPETLSRVRKRMIS